VVQLILLEAQAAEVPVITLIFNQQVLLVKASEVVRVQITVMCLVLRVLALAAAAVLVPLVIMEVLIMAVLVVQV
jgi:hypothetical protein